MARTYEPIASQTLGSAAASVTLSSLPGTYTDLRVVVIGSSASGNGLEIRFNGDSGSNYSWTNLSGDGSSAASSRSSSQTLARVGSITTGGPHYALFDVMSYANTNVYKTYLSAAGRDQNAVYRFVGLWRDTSAITSLTVLTTTGVNLSSGLSVSLYGIKAA